MIEHQPVPPDERRSGTDRRRRQRLLCDWRWARRGRRREVRRAADPAGTVLDRYPAAQLGPAFAVLLLSLADAALSATLIRGGAAEANPLAALLLAQGLAPFVWLKAGCTGFAVVWMVLYSRQRLFARIPVGTLLHALAGLYLVLVAYEAVLLV